MPRVRALILLGLFVVNQAACTSWQVPKVAPQEYVTQHPNTKVRVTPKDEHARPPCRVETDVHFFGDSVSGKDSLGQPIRCSLQPVATAKAGSVVLWPVRFSGDSVSGQDKKGQPIAYSLQQVATIEVREKDGGRTALAVIGIGLPISLLVLYAIAMNSCPGPAC